MDIKINLFYYDIDTIVKLVRDRSVYLETVNKNYDDLTVSEEEYSFVQELLSNVSDKIFLRLQKYTYNIEGEAFGFNVNVEFDSETISDSVWFKVELPKKLNARLITTINNTLKELLVIGTLMEYLRKKGSPNALLEKDYNDTLTTLNSLLESRTKLRKTYNWY